MYRKIFFYLLFMMVMTMNGCSFNLISISPEEKLTTYERSDASNALKDINPHRYPPLTSLPKQYPLTTATTKGDIVWTFDKVYHLEKMNVFMDHLQNKRKDMIRIVAYTMEGDPVITDLSFDGTTITAVIDDTRDKYAAKPSIQSFSYDSIVVEKRYSELYKGYFTEYLLKNQDTPADRLVLQLSPLINS